VFDNSDGFAEGNSFVVFFSVVDLFHFFAIAQKFGGYDKVTAIPYIDFRRLVI